MAENGDQVDHIEYTPTDSDDTVMYIKMAVVGGGGVGKSAMTIQFIQGRFVEEYDPTIEDIYRKQIEHEKHMYMLDILDTAGQEEYKALRDSYIREREAYLLVYAINSRGSFEALDDWHEDIEKIKETKDFPHVLVGNKSDLDATRKVSKAEGESLSKEWGSPFFECSAKTKENLVEAFYALVKVVREKKISTNGTVTKKKKSFCTLL